ncbi:MAG: hypothetical protein JNJ61_07435 [Anaerolineae bacterium]|nr:hypothetical protein [Anaerolineae bacterium]
MSDQELYAIAQERITRRNRRWTLWAVNLAALIISVAAVVLLIDSPYQMIGIAVMLGVAGIFVPHTIIAAMANSRDEDIESEVAKLRAALSYEKPKRLQLSDDDAVDDSLAWEYEEDQRRRKG